MLAQEYEVSLLCELLGCPRSSFYHPAAQTDEPAVKQAIEGVARPVPHLWLPEGDRPTAP